MKSQAMIILKIKSPAVIPSRKKGGGFQGLPIYCSCSVLSHQDYSGHQKLNSINTDWWSATKHPSSLDLSDQSLLQLFNVIFNKQQHSAQELHLLLLVLYQEIKACYIIPKKLSLKVLWSLRDCH